MKKNKSLHPYLIIMLTFAGVITLGTICLSWPAASATGQSVGIINALFEATSATCVTGLTTICIANDLSVFGKIIMALLIETGGLSFITIATFFFTVMGGKMGLSTRFMLKESLNQSSGGGLIKLVRHIMTIAFSIQALGAVINIYPFYVQVKSLPKAIGLSCFHAISAFNNAGFDLVGDSSLIPYANNGFINVTTMMLIILGSMGFIVITEILQKRKWSKFSLHAKIALSTTAVLIIGGALLIKLACQDDHFTWLQAAFSSVTSRTAGFTVYDLHLLKGSPGTYIVIVMLMLIGASPCSTGGGVKTTTFAVIILSIFYYAKGQKVKAFGRRLDKSDIFKAFVLMNTAILILVFGTICAVMIQPGLVGTLLADGSTLGLEEVIFEVVSAFSTTGLTMGITTLLSPANRILFCLLMFAGRIGPLTIIGILNKNWINDSVESVQYVKESVIIG